MATIYNRTSPADGTRDPVDVLVASHRSAEPPPSVPSSEEIEEYIRGGFETSSADGTYHSGGDAPISSERSAAKPHPAPAPTPFIDEYIPASLLKKYEAQNLQFNVTRSMLRQSRPVIGNTKRLHSYLKKLRSGECTTVLVLGGSVSAGHHVRRPEENSYPQIFVDWLNARYPCRARSGAAGTHERKKIRGASNSQTHMASWSAVDEMRAFDLVILEFNVNDHFISDLPHATEDKGPLGDTKEYISLWYFEVILRRILLVRKPEPPAIITFNADYQGRIWADPPWYEPEDARKTLLYFNQEPLKNWLSSMYEIPVFSAVIWMLPLAGKQGRSMQYNRTHNPYATANWHTDACCHPRREGHLILNMVLAYCMVEEEKVMLSTEGDDMAYEENDFTADQIPILRDPIYLSPEEDSLYVHNELKYSGVDFTHSDYGEKLWEDVIVANQGFEWYADNADKDKFGYIANNVTGGQHMAISLMGGRLGVIEVSYVISYENFGTALAWIDNSINISTGMKGRCSKTVNKGKQGKNGRFTPLIANWNEMASVPKVELLQDKLEEGKIRVLHVCLTPRSDVMAVGSENKFKLLGVRLY
eukprot:CAMPEP_0172535506 /NCGR_PEP_ID=MMETSP1067-20121228/7485_1 /TAXON_ID=265564 ORGANISM="Thalassiosira punctigera, Strain Tpunct2005C2" /NCGR_SAMPLE_ID=MMETSP1067 /ASSEMBLY_ACC=CAM_ASM_000444 /LENGTH=588 /DNA_ID=CAMNT_0013320443 /DNA_START=212 /DNA_END=1978 /DNA_ORIENTATION=-